ncbi:MAG TPA: winged helix-turn-helix domain-containing protein [Terriglobales bacterium]|nr:winged helix-turn-helix domain-containing protein [Terriglobales bacterium]
MPTTLPQERRLYRFGLYEVDLEQATLSRQGTLIKLQEQPFRILTLLLEAAGEVVSREELRKNIWPEGTFVEFDGSLNTALMKLRAALNDNAENPVFIETVPRRGYRFIAPVEIIDRDSPQIMTAIHVESDGDRNALELPLDSSGPPRSVPSVMENGAAKAGPSWRQVFVMLGGVVALMLFSLWPRTTPKVLAVRQLTHVGQVDPWGKLVTDGSRIYFVVRDVTGWNLMQTSVEGGNVQRTPTPFDNTRIFDLSPDHSQFLIGELTREGEETPLWLWPVQGGAPRRVGDVMAKEAVWSPQGSMIAFVREATIQISDSDGNHVWEVARFKVAPQSLTWSPDGNRLRFTQSNLVEGTDSMWEIGTDGKDLKRVLPGEEGGPHEGSGTWLAGGKYFAFSTGQDLRANLAVDTQANLWLLDERRGWFGRRGRDPLQLTKGPIALDHPAATPNGSRVFTIGSHSEYQLLRIDPKTMKQTAMLSESGATDMDFSLDGQWVVYAARENGTLWKSRIDGTNRVQLTAGATGAFAPHWSPDQKEILFTGFLLDKQPRLYIVSAQGGSPKPVLPTANRWASVSGDWRTDGRQIVVDVEDTATSGESNIRILDLETSRLASIPGSEGLIEPRWSADGRYIAALNPKKKEIWLYDCKTLKWSVLAEANFPSTLRWSPGGDALYYQDTDEVEESVFRVPMATRESEKVTRFGDLLSSGALRCIFTGLSPDGSVYVTVDHGDVDVYAIDLELP